MDVRNELVSSPLRIGISTRALFDLEEEHQVFENEGVNAYVQLQLDREDVLLKAGAGFEVVNRLLKLNEDKRSSSWGVCSILGAGFVPFQ